MVFSIFLASVLVTGCQTAADPAADEEIAAVDVTEEVMDVGATETAVAPTATATEDPPPLPTEEIPVDKCLDCHTDKDMLIQTADPEEEVISENEGAG